MADERSRSMQELDSLLEFMMPFAEETLRRYGELAPFGATVSNEGHIEQVMSYTGESAETEELLSLLLEGLRTKARAGSIRAAGWCVDVTFSHPDQPGFDDAIRASLEHADGESIYVFRPYRSGRRRRPRYADLVALKKEPEVFG